MFISVIERIYMAVFDESVLAYQPISKTKEAAIARGEPIPVGYSSKASSKWIGIISFIKF